VGDAVCLSPFETRPAKTTVRLAVRSPRLPELDIASCPCRLLSVLASSSSFGFGAAAHDGELHLGGWLTLRCAEYTGPAPSGLIRFITAMYVFFCGAKMRRCGHLDLASVSHQTLKLVS
jgi:hypothetical protein